MAFPEDYLHPSEELILDLKPHWFRIAPSSLSLLAAVVVGLFVLLKLDNDVLNMLVGVVILGTLGWFGISYARWVSTHLVLTSDRLIHREGVFSRAGVEIPLERINTVFSSQTVFERIMGAGDLTIESAGTEGRQAFEDVRKPTKVQNDIYMAMESNENRKYDRIAQSTGAPAAPAAPPGPSIPEQIEQLNELRQRGVISEEEFQRKKDELLKRM